MMRIFYKVITPAEILFQPKVEHNKEIPAAHFADLELGDARLAVAPGDGDHCKRIATNNGFEG